MSNVEKFEDLIAWQKARALTKEVYSATEGDRFARDSSLARQVQRAAVSVMANIAEGFERTGKAEFPHFLSTAKASCAEVRCHLYVALDVGYLDNAAFTRLRSQAEEVSRIISGLRTSVQKQRRADGRRPA